MNAKPWGLRRYCRSMFLEEPSGWYSTLHSTVLVVTSLYFWSQSWYFHPRETYFFHDVGAIHQLLVAAAARVVKPGQGSLLHVFREARPDHLSGVHIGVQSDDTGVFPAVGLLPQVHNTADSAVRQRVV